MEPYPNPRIDPNLDVGTAVQGLPPISTAGAKFPLRQSGSMTDGCSIQPRRDPNIVEPLSAPTLLGLRADQCQSGATFSSHSRPGHSPLRENRTWLSPSRPASTSNAGAECSYSSQHSLLIHLRSTILRQGARIGRKRPDNPSTCQVRLGKCHFNFESLMAKCHTHLPPHWLQVTACRSSIRSSPQ